MSDWTETVEDAAETGPVRGPALVIAWSREEPHRVAERMVFVDGRTVLFGRGGPYEKDSAPRTWSVQMRPGLVVDGGPFVSGTLSRVQALITRKGNKLEIENRGRAPMRVGGHIATVATVSVGDVVVFARRLVLLCVDSPNTFPARPGIPMHPFGTADENGIVGESEAAWELRGALSFSAPRQAHVLVVGPSGAGKELVARALHRLSGRANGPWIDRNAATLPQGLVDVELFGHARNFPNPGMPKRPGLIGEAKGGTLFLDEIGELPVAAQAHLLRVLDEGRYQRLGETTPLRADIRFIAATNRAPEALKHDLRARLKLTVEVPGLNERLGDLALLQRHLLNHILASDEGLAEQFTNVRPRFSEEFVVAALSHSWQTHARELEAWIWRALSVTSDKWLRRCPPSSQGGSPSTAPVDTTDNEPAVWRHWVGSAPSEIPADALESCLSDHNGNQGLTWRALGLGSRYVLHRLIKRHGLVVSKRG